MSIFTKTIISMGVLALALLATVSPAEATKNFNSSKSNTSCCTVGLPTASDRVAHIDADLVELKNENGPGGNEFGRAVRRAARSGGAAGERGNPDFKAY